MGSHQTQRCPACDAVVPLGASQCVACGLALGEPNWCPGCHAFAAVYARPGRYVCGACGADRVVLPGTIIATEAELLTAFDETRRSWSSAALALAAMGSGSAWIAHRALPGGWNLVLPLVLVAGSLFGAYGLARGARRSGLRRARRRRFEIEQRIIGLAFRNDGLLRAEEVSSTLRIPLAEAEALLAELARSGRASLRATPAGEAYDFTEAKRTQTLRVRAAERR